jgi:hypothetical protein
MVRKGKATKGRKAKAVEVKRSAMVAAAEELNEIFDAAELVSAVDPENDDLEEIVNQFKEAHESLEEDDDVSEETTSLIETIVKSKGKFTIDEDMEEEEEEEGKFTIDEDMEEEEEEEPAPKKKRGAKKAPAKKAAAKSDSEFASMSMVQLRKAAKEAGLKIGVGGGVTKQYLIDCLEAGEVLENDADDAPKKGKASAKKAKKEPKEKKWTRADSAGYAFQKRPKTKAKLLSICDQIHEKKGGIESGTNQKTVDSMLRYAQKMGIVELNGGNITYLDE